MKLSFWIRRFLVVFTGAFAVLFAVAILRGRSADTGATESAIWSLVATSIFLTTRIIRSRQGQHCELCRDTPEFAGGGECAIKPGERRP